MQKIGAAFHDVVIGDAKGTVLEHFQIDHHGDGLDRLFRRIAHHQSAADTPVSVAMKGFNGWARPLDQPVLDRGWTLYNVNNLKFARYKEIFPAPAKTDAIDAKRIFELFAFQGQMHIARGVLQAVPPPDPVHKTLKYLTRRRRQCIQEKITRLTRLRVDLQAYAPGLMSITTAVDRLWFLRFLTAREDLRQLAKLRRTSVLGIPGIGTVFAERIINWQQQADFAPDIDLASADIVDDARALILLIEKINGLERRITEARLQSAGAQLLQTIPGFGDTGVAELAGEIGSIKRFSNEASLAFYVGMAPLDRSSGLVKRGTRSNHVNKQYQLAMMTSVARHVACVPKSKAFYDHKRQQGKSHNQAIRALGRHLVRVMWRMLERRRKYVVQPQKSAD